MIPELSTEIFYMLMGMFLIMFACGVIFRSSVIGGIFMFFAGTFLLIIWIPVSTIDFGRVDYINVTSSGSVGNETITEDTVYGSPVEIDYTVKAMIVVFAAFIMLFGWYIGDFGSAFDSI